MKFSIVLLLVTLHIHSSLLKILNTREVIVLLQFEGKTLRVVNF